MHYHSTRSPGHHVSLKEAVLRSLPADNGLYMPDAIPVLPAKFWESWRMRSLAEIGTEVAHAFFGEDIPRDVIEEIVQGAIDFEAPLVTLAPDDHILELFHGPTLAFKDFGARFMARLMAWLTRADPQTLTVLVATSGDTGGAVASAYHQVPGTRVFILYPKGKVSVLQEKQLTTLGGNIHALEVDGSFDDCQDLVKSAFLDPALCARLNLTSANSINLARLIPQTFYYFHAARQLPEGVLPVFVVPSGNFGNLTAGLIAQRLGLPVAHFIAATNINDVVPVYLASGEYHPRPSQATLSNAMDVGSPSNFARMRALFGDSWEDMTGQISGYAFTDKETLAAMRKVREQHDHILDPHGAIGWLAAQRYRETHPGAVTITLETAHSAKFIDIVEREFGPGCLHIPERLATLAAKPKVATPLPADREGFLAWLGGQ